MSDPNIPNPSNLGVVVTNRTARAWIYGLYVVALIAVECAARVYAALELGNPDWVVATREALLYLGIPVGALAAANLPAKSN